MIELSELQKDALGELLNIGMGRASASLSEMVGEEVELSVPKVDTLSQEEAIERIKGLVGDNITAVKESFKGAFWGDALLLFPEEHSLELVRALIKDDTLPLDMLSEMEQEALTEVGNIILNACLGSLANIFQENLEFALPQYSQGSCEDVIKSNTSSETSSEGVLLLQMNFALQKTKVSGYLTLIMDVASMHALSKQLSKYFGGAV
ncbi:MAG: chemotaxis protein CheC [Colwellia sp.]|nr:chemotaxis protein CheC [Colwellia sp.]